MVWSVCLSVVLCLNTFGAMKFYYVFFLDGSNIFAKFQMSLGISYSLLASGLWPLVALIVPENQLGTAYGM